MERDITHPVWEVYDAIRTTRLNVKYFRCKLTILRKQNFWLEFILAATASSAVVTFQLWKSNVGSIIWQTLSIISALLAIANPLLKLTEKIRKMEELLTTIRTLEHDLEVLKETIYQRQEYDNELKNKFLLIVDSRKSLIGKFEEGKIDNELRHKLQMEVQTELPASSFYLPPK
jgi:hypothetical protein